MMTVPYLTGVALTKQNLESYRRALKESGYNPADFEVSCTSLVYLDEFRNTLDFGLAALEAGGSWLEIAVRAHGSPDSYTVLMPRQKLTSTPYAILAQAESWSLIGVPVGFRGKVTEAVAADGPVGPSLTHEEAAAEPPIKSIRAWKEGAGSAEPTGVAAPQNTPNFIAKFDSRGSPLMDSIMYDNGTNVGVGTINPQRNLSVNGSMNVDQADANNGTSAIGISFGSSSGEVITSKRTTGGNRWGLDFYTAFAPRVSITNNGNVGIGTTNPAAKLDVSGVALFGTAVSAGPNVGLANIRLGADGIANDIEIGSTNRNIRDVAFYNPGGGFTMNAVAANFVTASDARLKTNVTTLTHALEKVNQIRGVSFDWTEMSGYAGGTPGTHDIGVIAQEVEAVFPELVSSSGPDGYKRVSYPKLTPVLIEAVKELKTGQEALRAENEELRTRLEALEHLVQKLTRDRE